jgi:hypothetical protein
LPDCHGEAPEHEAIRLASSSSPDQKIGDDGKTADKENEQNTHLFQKSKSFIPDHRFIIVLIIHIGYLIHCSPPDATILISLQKIARSTYDGK